MLRLYVPNLNKEGIGGGNTFISNYKKYTHYDLIENIDKVDKVFIVNPMWAERSDIESAKKNGLEIIMRLDNIPEDWNNRGTAISKLTDFIGAADKFIFQSQWAFSKYIEFDSFRHKKIKEGANNCKVILNGVDTQIFKPYNIKKNDDTVTFIYVKSSRNENKRYPEALEAFRRYWYSNRNSKLLLIGAFADDIIKYNFGFYNGEDYRWLGPVKDKVAMADYYNQADVLLFPAFADCAPNVVLEATACGCFPIINPYGGAIEYVAEDMYDIKLDDRAHSAWKSYRIYKKAISDYVANNFSMEKCAEAYDDFILDG